MAFSFSLIPADPEGPGLCAMLLTIFSFFLVLVTMPFSLCVTVKVSTIREIYFGTGMLEDILLKLTFDEFCGEMLKLVISV